MTRPAWTWAAARCRGVMHQRAGTRVQDAFACFAPQARGQPLVAVVSDGAGSTTHGGYGAALLCRCVCSQARQHFASVDSLPDVDHLRSWMQVGRQHIAAAAARRQLLLRDFAATLVLMVSDGAESRVLHVGDGCAVIRDATSGAWSAITWPDHGEYASMTYFVTDELPIRMQTAEHQGGISALALFSDGLEQLVLDLKARQPHGPFFDSMITPVASSSCAGKDRELSEKLSRFLNGAEINQRTEDDKTLILAVRR